MSHDVFISHASGDRLQADALCAALEAHGIGCWIAPRDVVGGRTTPRPWSTLSRRAELSCSCSRGVPIVPIRVEDAPMAKAAT